ncbi:uncharacterized protein LOC143344029 isoform X2 [Colletes latitarsis]|uniref:uncharacterized protein LOC143344029 isoform X2 n=1 Tax=Colletes latitarsis TaxID=2605962 RepID=UPI0040354069
MRNGMITTRADVYTEEIPGTSNSVIMTSESPSPLQTSMPLVDYDVTDDARSGKITPTAPTIPVMSKLLNSGTTDTETIENAVPIAQTVLPVPEPRPKIERNGIDSETKKSVAQPNDDSCVVDCIYFTQQCCECMIL